MCAAQLVMNNSSSKFFLSCVSIYDREQYCTMLATLLIVLLSSTISIEENENVGSSSL